MNVFASVLAATALMWVVGVAQADTVFLDGRDAASPSPRDPIAWNWASSIANANRPVTLSADINDDSLGRPSGSMVYPAPNVLGLLVSVATHAVIADAAQKSQKTKMQETADKVLGPYKTVLADFDHTALLHKSLALLPLPLQAAYAPQGGVPTYLLESKPEFRISQDERALVVDNTVSVRTPADPSAPAYKITVQVVSQPTAGRVGVAAWTADQGEPLKTQAALLMAQSLRVAISAKRQDSAPQLGAARTFRYTYGGMQRFERGQLVNSECDWTVVKTLRGALLSFRTQDAPACAESEIARQ